MRIAGDHRIGASRQQVWDALRDPDVLVRTLPGVTSLVAVDENSYEATMQAGVASIKGTYRGTVRLADAQPPDAYRMHVSGAGVPGTVDATVAVRLESDGDGGTHLHYDADAQVGGMIGGVGQRMLSAVARRMAGEFFDAVEAELATPQLTQTPPEAPAAPSAVPAPVAPSSGEVVPPPTTHHSAPPQATVSRMPELVTASVAGGLLALAGVLVGRRLGRGSRR